MTGVQRFLSGHKNHVRGATFTGPVKAIADAVVKKPVARSGNASASLSGSFTGTEPATFEVEITDAIATVPLVSAPAFVGIGTGEMENIVTTGLGARTITVELAELGQLLQAAETELQGVRVLAKTAGVVGNALRFRVTRTGLVFTPQTISLLTGLAAGTQSVIGPEFDWDTKIMTGDGQVPTDAHRVSFGENQNNIYIQYKRFVEGQYAYFFEPAIKEDVDIGTIVNFVTGTYTVELLDGSGVLETYASVVTLYDLLNAIKSTSSRLIVEGPVAFDRAPGGQALAELAVRTDAHAATNTGFTEVDIQASTPTELVEATCYAATAEDSDTAGIGQELWTVKGSVSGVIAESIKTGDLIVAPHFSAKIKSKLPPAIAIAAQGRIAVGGFNMASRAEGEITPELCPASLTLGINAQEQTLTFTYAARAVAGQDCPCSDMAAPDLSGSECLGIPTTSTGDINVPAYTDADTRSRVKDLYDWFADTVRSNSSYLISGGVSSAPQQDPFVSGPIYSTYTAMGKTLVSIVESFEKTLAYIDPLTPGAVKTAGYTAWDTAFTELQDDVTAYLGGGGTGAATEDAPAFHALADGDAVCIFEESPGTLKVRKAVAGGLRYGFLKAAYASGATATVHFSGLNDAIVSTESFTGGTTPTRWWPSVANPGHWVLDKNVGTAGDPAVITNYNMTYVSATEGLKESLSSSSNPYAYALLGDRYISRLKWVLSEAELSPRGKFDANGLEAGDDCWRDLGDDYYWQVSGASGAYAPAFTNQPYYSARKGQDNVYRGTKEFALQINVACPENLKVGDSFTVVISNVPSWDRYQKGDKVTLGILAAGDLFFFGGRDGDNVQQWFVNDSVAGALPPYDLDLDAPVAYDSGTGVEFLISEGSIPFAKGDKFTFSIEGGHFKWRSIVGGVAGAWSAPAAITAAPMLLGSGLSLSFALGESPSFFTGDTYRFLALQPYALSNIIAPDFAQWVWGAASPAVMVMDLGALKNDIGAIALSFHSLPSTATVLVEGSTDGVTYTWDETVTWRKDVMTKLLAANESARYIRLTITGAAQAGVGGVYIGPALAFTNSAEVSVNRQYRMLRGNGVNAAARHQGTAAGGRVTWREGALTDDDYPLIVEMIDWLKKNQDEPLIFFPQYTRSDEVVVATIEADEIEFNDVLNFQPDAAYDRRLSATLPLQGVAFV